MNKSEPKPCRAGSNAPRGNGRRVKNARGPFKESRSLNSDQDVPMLKFGPNNNFVLFKERMSTACMEKYGPLGRLINKEEYWVPPDIEESEYMVKDKDGKMVLTEVSRQSMAQAIKERVSLVAKMKSNRDNMFAYIESKLSKESLDEVKRHRDYESVKDEVDPLKLWLIIKELHMVTTSSRVEAVVKRKAWEEYAMCKQGVFESLVDYKARFDSKYDSYVAQGNPEKSEEDRAMDFLEGLDKSRYGEFVVEVINDVAKGSMQTPKSVNEVYVLANTRLIVRKNNNYNVGASYATIENARSLGTKSGKANKNKKGSKRGTSKQKESSTSTNSDTKESEKESSEKKEIKKKWVENRECFNCGKKGHLARDCTEYSKDDDDSDDGDDAPLAGVAIESIEDDLNCLYGCSRVKPNEHEIILDSGSEINCVHPRFLVDIKSGSGGFKGLSGDKTKVTKIGTLVGFFECLSSERIQASVLSLADVEDVYPVTYKRGKSYTVHMPDRDIVFVRKGKLYLGDFSDWIKYKEGEHSSLSLVTTKDNEHMYTKKEVAKAREATEFLKNAGYPSEAEAIHLVRDGNLEGVPVSVQDVKNSFDIYGPPVEMLRGKMTNSKKTLCRDNVDAGIKEERKIQNLTTDIMYVNEEPFLVSVASPLELTISSYLTSQHKNRLGEALQVQLNLLRSYGFDARMVVVDPLKALAGLRGSFPGVEIDPVGAGDHLPKVDAKIRRIKETCRSIIAGLPYDLPKNRVKDLVTYVVNRINTRRTSSLSDNICPRTKLTGRKINFSREYKLGFGDYVEAYDPKVRSNSMRSRSEPCIALYPSANISGSWVLWNINSGKYVRRTHWRKLPIPESIIKKMNELAGSARVEAVDAGSDIVMEPEGEKEPREPTVVPGNEPTSRTMTVEESEIVEAENESSLVDASNQYGGADATGEEAANENDSETMEPELRRSSRSNAGRIERDSNFSYSFSQFTVKEGLRIYGDRAKEAVVAEFLQLFKNKKAVIPVKKSSLTRKQLRKIIRSSMFLKEKFDAFGVFEKLKGRLVGDGRMQDRSLYKGLESPTGAIESIIMCMLIGCMRRAHFGKVDIGGAYLNALLAIGDEIHMEIRKEIVDILVEALPELREYVTEDGKLIVQILKALYGLLQSAALWFETFSSFLKSIGFVPNEVDKCVMNKKIGDRMMTIILYVDDVLIISPEKDDIKWLIAELEKEYGEVSVELSDKFTYLGMGVKVNNDHSLELSMTKYIDDILESFPEYESLKTYATPASTKLFEKPRGKLLNIKSKERFHTTVAKLLYLCKRTRPDIQLPTLFLCTRVKSPSESDDEKLRRILGYLKLTRKKKRVIRCSMKMLKRVLAYVDASFAIHYDGKGHTGLVIIIAGVVIYTYCGKQKIATKDSTESELVALSDMIVRIEKVDEFLRIQGVELTAVPLILQDNTSTITLVTEKDSGIVRTKHLQARKAVVYEQVMERKMFSIKHVSTKQMIADVLTKPLGGEAFYVFANVLMGWSTPGIKNLDSESTEANGK